MASSGASDPLAALRDVHAPGVAKAPLLADLAFAGLLGLLAALVVSAVAVFVLRRRAPVRQAALAALAASRAFADGPERLLAQAALLRRVVRTREGSAVARERGLPWLERLDRTFGTDFFTRGPGAAYGDALYARTAAEGADPAALDCELEPLLRRLRG